MGLNPFDSEKSEEDSEVYIDAEGSDSSSSSFSRSKDSQTDSDDTLEMELEDKLADNNQSQSESTRDNVDLQDIYDQNEEIIGLLEKINNKM